LTTLYIKRTRSYTPPYSIEKNYLIATQKRNLLSRIMNEVIFYEKHLKMAMKMAIIALIISKEG